MKPMFDTEIESDGNTVWVNRGICIGRFCRLSSEILRPGELKVLDCTPHPTAPNPTDSDWRDFVRLVAKRYGVEIGEEHRPQLST